MNGNKFFVLITWLAGLISLITCAGQPEVVVKSGAEVLIENHLQELSGKRVGLVMNPTARIGNVHMLDTLRALDVNLTALFAPEHGFRGDEAAGEVIKDGVDQGTGLPVYSLYGSSKKPTPEMLSGVDLLLFDMQDVGARFYTYNSTMKYILEAAAENDKEIWILDRPNPAGGNYMAGWVLEEEFKSFVGMYPIPVAHGLTLGELALMASGEGWLDSQKPPDLRIIPMEGWRRSMKWPDTGMKWVPPSPNLPTFEHAYIYLGTCFFEGTTMSEGRGTEDPFLTIGAPDLKVDLEEMEELSSKYGVKLDTISFIPENLPGKATHPKHEGVRVRGVFIQMTQKTSDPVSLGIELMHELMDRSANAEYKEYLFSLSGTKEILTQEKYFNWGKAFEEFAEKRENYLLYK